MFDFLHELLIQCGWPGLVGACIIGAIYFLINRSINQSADKTANKMNDIIANQNTVLIKSMIDMLDKNQTEFLTLISKTINKTLDLHDENKKKNHKNSINRRLKITESVQDIVTGLRKEYHSSRCALLEIHNNQENLAGLSHVWYDTIYESKQRNITSISPTCLNNGWKNIPISQIMPVIKDITKNNGLVHYSTTDLAKFEEEFNTLYEQLTKELEIKDAIFVGIYNKSNEINALLFIEYSHSYEYNENIVNLEDIKKQADIISSKIEYIG